MKAIDIWVPVKTVSELNQREHWAERMRRQKTQQAATVAAMMNGLHGHKVEFPCLVKLTRIGPKRMDADNLASSFKHIQDAIAHRLGVDDGDVDKVTWEYAQKPVGISGKGDFVHGVKISITERKVNNVETRTDESTTSAERGASPA